MFANKPVIGLSGGIGSGKSYVAGLFGRLGCRVIDSDALSRAALQEPEVAQTIGSWWGDAVASAGGGINRSGLAKLIFDDPDKRQRLEQLLHPRVAAARQRAMSEAVSDPSIQAFVLDSPLLFETGLSEHCDAVVFLDTPLPERQRRVSERGWDAAELERREKNQWTLDKKQKMSDICISNTAEAGDLPHAEAMLRHVQEILQRVLSGRVRTGQK